MAGGGRGGTADDGGLGSTRPQSAWRRRAANPFGLDRVHNFRGAGAVAGVVRPGLVFRTGALDEMTPADAEALFAPGGLGIQTYIDLRSVDTDAEHAAVARVERLAKGRMRRVHLALAPWSIIDGAPHTVRPDLVSPPRADVLDFIRRFRALRDETGKTPITLSTQHLIDTLVEINVLILRHSGALLRAALRLIAPVELGTQQVSIGPASHPVAFGCTAGKDRTGLLSALFLGALGASRTQIIADYMVTNETHAHKLAIKAAAGTAPADNVELLRMWGVHRSIMERTLDAIDTEYGGVVSYLKHIGLWAGEISGMRRAFRRRDAANPFGLARVPNFRELGAGTGLVAPRRVFRTGMLDWAVDGDIAALRALGVRTYLDLRSIDDGGDAFDRAGIARLREVAGDAPRRVEAPLDAFLRRAGAARLPGVADFAAWRDAVAAEHGLAPFYVSDAHQVRFLVEYTILILRHSGDLVRDAMALFTRAENYPIAFGCHTGKDRTGVIGALLLGVLGATRDEVVADYELSNDAVEHHVAVNAYRRAQPGFAAPATPPTDAQRRRTLGVHAEVMSRVLDWIDEHHGSAVGYLRSVGFSAADLAAVRAAMAAGGGPAAAGAPAAKL